MNQGRTARLAALVGCVVLTGGLAAPATAGDWGVGVGVGQVDWDDVAGVAVADPGSPGSFVLGRVDDSDTSTKVWVTRHVRSTFDLEGAWHDWGTLRNTADVTGGTASASADAWALSLSALGRWPVTERFDLFVRLAWYRWESEIDGPTALARDDDGVELSWGLGVDARLTRRLALRVEWEKLEDIDFFQGDLYTAGVTFDF